MTTTTLTLARMELDTDGEWLVIDRDGDIHDSYTDRSEARDVVNSLNDDYREEELQDSLTAARDEIQDMMDGCEDIDLLNRIRAMLAGK